jgi:hypothetical protein
MLETFPYPENPEHHFVVDPDKFDFYAMDCYRIVGENALAQMHANEVIRKSTAPDGTDRAPMRTSEARITLGIVAARNGDLDEALVEGTEALNRDRRSMPTLLMTGSELARELAKVSPSAQETTTYRDQLAALTLPRSA